MCSFGEAEPNNYPHMTALEHRLASGSLLFIKNKKKKTHTGKKSHQTTAKHPSPGKASKQNQTQYLLQEGGTKKKGGKLRKNWLFRDYTVRFSA